MVGEYDGKENDRGRKNSECADGCDRRKRVMASRLFVQVSASSCLHCDTRGVSLFLLHRSSSHLAYQMKLRKMGCRRCRFQWKMAYL